MSGWMASSWFWWSLALLLFAIEAIAPGVFMLWLGAAAVATALIVLVVDIPIVGQWVLFSLLGLLAVGLGWRYRSRNAPAPSDQPLLNQKAKQLVDRVFVLDTPMVNGRGRLKIGDAFWTADGEDLPAGTRVRIIAVDGMVLKVRAVE
jgi:inner membrane protein